MLKNIPPINYTYVRWFLRTVAFLLLISLYIRAVVDGCGLWDSLDYHIPFASILWGIIPENQYILNQYWLEWYEGMALFGEFLQGFFWYVTGRPETTNLVGYFSLILYIYFLKSYFKVPIYLSTIALLAIPLVQVHATASYVDLPGSIAMSVLILMTYRLYINPDDFNKQDLLILFLGAACATNIRIKLVPLVFLVLCFVLLKLIRHSIQTKDTTEKPKFRALTRPIYLFFGLVIIFAAPIKNTLIHANPFYPIAIKIGNTKLNSTRIHVDKIIPGKKTSRPERWMYSIFEIIPRPLFRGHWNHDSSSHGPDDRKGGYFGFYVLVNIIFFGYLVFKIRNRKIKFALILLVIMSFFNMISPSSAKLRYYMFWMIVLVSLNLYFGTYYSKLEKLPKYINDASIGMVTGLVLTIVISSTNAKYIFPQFISFEEIVKENIQPEFLRKIKRGDPVCLPRKLRPFRYLYIAKFHPPAKYSVKNCKEFKTSLY